MTFLHPLVEKQITEAAANGNLVLLVKSGMIQVTVLVS